MLVNQLAEVGINQLNISSQNNVLMDDVEMDVGSLLCPFVTLTSNIKIGKAFNANIYSYAAHDCVIGVLLRLRQELCVMGIFILKIMLILVPVLF